MAAPINPNKIPRKLNFKSKTELKRTPNKTGSLNKNKILI